MLPTNRLILALCLPLTLGACSGKKKDSPTEGTAAKQVEAATDAAEAPAVPTNNGGKAPELHGSRWAEGDDDEPRMGGFTMFKEAWLYVDGVTVGVMREVELPDGLPIAWSEEIESLDFNRGDPGPRERLFHAKRWRISDYLVALGYDLKKIKQVIIHGGRGSLPISGADFRKFKDELRFDLTGNRMDKLRVFLPNDLKRQTSYDRYIGVSVLIDKKPITVDKSNEIIMDGEMTTGIPYRGDPARGGVRVYLDGKLVMVVKRNLLGDIGKVDEMQWNVGALLEAVNVKIENIAAADLVVDDDRTRLEAFDIKAFNLISSDDHGGKMMGGPKTEAIEAIMMFSKDKVPPVWKRAPWEQFPDGSVKH